MTDDLSNEIRDKNIILSDNGQLWQWIVDQEKEIANSEDRIKAGND